MSLLDDVRGLVDSATAAYAGTPHEDEVVDARRRLDEPLRVAIAGKVKAGKSTLLNALVGERLAPTDARECTRVVSWYVDGPTYRATVHPVEGPPRQAKLRRVDGRLDVELGMMPEDVERLVVEWPSATLREATLIDTPGIASASTHVSARTISFLAPGEDEATPADAVVYLLRHLHASDVGLLEAFHDDDVAQATPVNAIGVLSRADEVAAGRLDAMQSATRIAARYRGDRRLRRLCQTVVPVAGLLAETATTLREDEYAALTTLVGVPRAELEALLLSADRFVRAPVSVDLSEDTRAALLHRFGVFGVRLATALIRGGAAPTASALAAELLARSGMVELRRLLATQFAERRAVLKARAALLAIDALARSAPVAGSDRLLADVERVTAGAHELAELRLLNGLRAGTVRVRDDEVEDLERLIGGSGGSPVERLGLDVGADPDTVRAAAAEAHARWQRRATSPMSTRETAEAAGVAVRTCEGLLR